MADRIADPWGPRAPYGAGDSWPVRVDMHLEDGVSEAEVERWVPSASVLHSNGDAMDIPLPHTCCFEVVQACEGETATQLQWLKSRMKEAAPQALVVTS